MSGPGIPAGEVRDDPFLTADFAPTFLELAGAQTDRVMDGISMLDVARSGDRGWTRAVFTEAGPRNLAGGREPPLQVYPGGPSSLRFSQGVRTPRYLYVEHATDDQELYDLRTDPDELESVVDLPRMRGVARQLAAVLDRLRMCEGETCQVPLPPALRRP
jgi:arylsulfatase A-like enzyme